MNCIAWLAVEGNSSFLRLAVIASTFMSAILAGRVGVCNIIIQGREEMLWITAGTDGQVGYWPAYSLTGVKCW